MSRIFLVLDRTMVLFIGIAVGAVVGISFFAGRSGGEADAAPAPPAEVRQGPAAALAATPPRPAAPDSITPRLAAAMRENRTIQVGVFGDSFGDGVWAGLYNILRSDRRFEVRQYSERSTGFTRYRSLNLLDDVRAKLDRQPLDIAVISYGANDTQGIYLDGHGYQYMSEGWQRIVTERVTAIVGLLRERGVMIYWVGLPKMRDAEFDGQIRQMNAFYAARMQALGVPYVEIASMTVDAQGQYVPYLTDPRTGTRTMARLNDGKHMTIPGYIILTRGLSDRIRRQVGGAPAERRASGPSPAARPERSRGAGTAG